MRKATKYGLFFLLIVFGLVGAAPEKAKEAAVFLGVFDCCKGEAPGAWCERRGCWLPLNLCSTDAECNLN